MSEYKHIVLVGGPNHRGWYVRVGNRTRHFAFRKWGGEDAALEQAIAWRDSQVGTQKSFKVVRIPAERKTKDDPPPRRKRFSKYNNQFLLWLTESRNR